MEFGMSCRIKPKEKYVRISLTFYLHNLDGPPKNKKLTALSFHLLLSSCPQLNV